MAADKQFRNAGRYWSLTRALAAFASELRAQGVTVSPAESADALAALQALPVTDKPRFAAVLRACMAKTPDDRARFDTVFDAFWGDHFITPAKTVERDAGDEDHDSDEPARGTGDGGDPDPARGQTLDETQSDGPNDGASGQRRAMQADLAAIDERERAAMERLIRALGRQLARRAARRWRRRAQGRLDLRASLRSAIARGGEVFAFRRRYRPRERPRLVVFADVSYSMDAYSRFFLCFVHAFGQAFRSMESFVFSTQLSRVTEPLARGRVEAALARLADTVDDWAGGTRIATSLEAFMARHADQMLDRNTVVMIVSDGWDSDEPERLQAALKQLRARCRALIWLDPLMDHPRYFTTALGVQHDSPHVDLCAPARDLDGLARLVDRLSRKRLV
ncbi:VWA containing CoxE family protein [Salinisphaera dokdonensis CL-ES53]|uniref:VWA containing CoxE family protein n=1 Tax=Salinisphaera dokdonensis CL-ES53 TaxID=1304272 RepID=A0ABV2B240_9GAMM